MSNYQTRLQETLNRVVRYISADIWRIPLKDVPFGKTFLISQLRVLILALRGVREDKIHLRAPALTLISAFSVVPALALVFSIARGFGLEMYVERQLQAALAGREEVLNWMLDLTRSFLTQFQEGYLAVIGTIMLLYTISRLLINIEYSFNEIWQVSRGRSPARKFTDYFAIMFIAPLFFIMAGAATVLLNAQIQQGNNAFLSPLLFILIRLLPYLLIWIVLTLVYIVMPNTSVKFSAALFAGIIAGTVFQLVQWIYVKFQIGVSSYNAIYGSFAALPLLLLWIQVSWLVVLFGAELSYAKHNVANYEFEAETKKISAYNKKILALYILHLLVAGFQRGDQPQTPGQISKTLEIPNNLVRKILNELEEVSLVSQISSERPAEASYQPAIDIQTISIRMLLERLDKKGMDVLIAKPSPLLDNIKDTLFEFYNLLEEAPANKLLKDL
jgi:membrane protein